MTNKKMVTEKASRAIRNTERMIDVRDAENDIKEIQRLHFQEGMYTEEEYQTLIDFYSREKKKIVRKNNNKTNADKKKINKKKNKKGKKKK